MTTLVRPDGSSTCTASAEPADARLRHETRTTGRRISWRRVCRITRAKNPCRPLSDRAPDAQRAKSSGVSWRRGFLPSGFDAPPGHAPGHCETTWRPKVASIGLVGLVQRY